MKRLVLGIAILLVLAWGTLVGWDRWVNAHRILAGPENETAFYRTYDPGPVIQGFRYPGESYGAGHGIAASQLIKQIRHSEEFSPEITLQSNRQQELLHALREDILLRFRSAGISVVESQVDPYGGFQFRYVSGNSVGRISVGAPVRRKVERHYQLPRGLVDINLNITLGETWTRPANATALWMALVD